MSAAERKVLFTSHTANFHKFNRPFMRMLKEQGYEVHYASAGEEKVYDTDKHFDVPFERSPFKLGNIKAYFKLKKIINSGSYDLIHTHTPMGSVVTRLAARTARKNGTRVIYTAHGFHFFKGAPILNWIIYYPIEKYMARHTNTLITINKEDYKRAKKSFKTDVQYVPGVGIDTKKFDIKFRKNDKLKLRRSLSLSDNDFVMIYLAELSKRKNQQWLIGTTANLMRKNPRIHLLLVGKDSLNGQCQALAEKLDIASNVHFLGYRSDVPELLKMSDLAVSSSRQEGLPVNIMEAMYVGLPIVATDCRGNRDLINESTHNYHIVKGGDSEMFSESILNLYKETIRGDVVVDNTKHEISLFLEDVVLEMNSSIYFDKKSDSPMRVLQIVTSMNRAGLETMLMNYYRNINRNKVQFDFLVHRQEKGDYDDEIIALGGRIYHTEPISFGSLGTYNKNLINFLLQHTEYDIVHSHMDALSALPLSAAKAAKVPVRIAHSHNNNFSFDKKYLIRMFAKNYIKNNATDFFACSYDASIFMFGKKTDSKIIYNAIETGDFVYTEKTRRKVRAQMGLKKKFVIGHVGRFTHQKNHDFLIDIFYKVHSVKDDAVLLLVGTGEEESAIKLKVKSLGLEDSVQFLGSRTDISKLMHAMDVFVLPSYYEGLPVVLVEAQTSGLRCIASDNVSKEADMGLCEFINLADGVDIWAKSISRDNSIKRQNAVNNLHYHSYDIRKEAPKLEGLYIERLQGV